MVKVFRLLTIILAFSPIVFSQSKKDLKERNLRSKVHQINYYDVYQNSELNSPNSVEKRLSAIDVFNRKGNLRVRFGFSRNGKDCFYKKNIYSYDAKNRKQTEILFQSETGENICPGNPPVFQENEAENLAGELSFIDKTIYEYEDTGKISRKIVYDLDNKTVQQDNYAYNRRGENIRYTVTQEKNRISGASSGFVRTIDFRMFSRDKGKIKETFRYEDGKPIQREIYYNDKKKRAVSGELYKLESDAQNNIVREIIGFRTNTFYQGNKELLVWTIYDQNGDLQTQLYILSENDNELMRLEYNYRNRAKDTNQNDAERITHYQFENISLETINQLKYLLKFDECVENPNWLPGRFETRSYKFDVFGNLVRYVFQERDKLSKAIKDKSIYEQEIIYYR